MTPSRFLRRPVRRHLDRCERSECWQCGGSGAVTMPCEVEANARLIAAAPDLLAALQEIRDICSDGNFDVNAVRRIAERAIAKAG